MVNMTRRSPVFTGYWSFESHLLNSLQGLTKWTLRFADPGTGAFNPVRICTAQHMREMCDILPLRLIFGIMTTASLKKKIKSLVDAEKGTQTLRRIHDLLTDPPLYAGQQDALAARLDRAEDPHGAKCPRVPLQTGRRGRPTR